MAYLPYKQKCMKIALVGYMGCGKSFWANALASALECDFIDLDRHLEMFFLNEKIANFIPSKGEIAFRKQENMALKSLVDAKNSFVLATGGGSPCYFNNMEMLNDNFKTIYLNVSITTLVKRLENEKLNRPLIAHIKTEDLHEFVAKHLFERRNFYAQAHVVLNENDTTLENLTAHIRG